MDRLQESAIVRSAADLRILAAEINAAHKAGEESARRGIEHFRVAGEALLKAKKECGHGKWQQWMKDNLRFSPQTARAYMRLAANPAKTKGAFVLADALRLLTAEPKEQEDARASARDGPEDQDHLPNGGLEEAGGEGQDENAEAEQTGQANDTSAFEAMPERYKEILASGDAFDTAERAATRAANALRHVEESPAYRAMEVFETQVQKNRNFTKRMYSSDLRAAARLMKGLKPAKLCPECRGIEASQDAELCATCGGKGFLIADEVDDA